MTEDLKKVALICWTITIVIMVVYYVDFATKMKKLEIEEMVEKEKIKIVAQHYEVIEKENKVVLLKKGRRHAARQVQRR